MLSTLHMSARFLVNCFALHRLSIALLFVLLDTHSESDFPDFASSMLDSDTSAFHSGLDHFARRLRSRNGDNER